MNWKDQFTTYIYTVSESDDYTPRERDRLLAEGIKLIENAIREEVNKALYVLSHEDPPLSDERLDQCQRNVTNRRAAVWPSIQQFFDMINWQKARIAHMAKDNGYNDGIEAGRAEWNRQNYEWIKKVEWGQSDTNLGSFCPVCGRNKYYLGEHTEDCSLGNYLKNNKPKVT